MLSSRCLTSEDCLAHLERRANAVPAEDVLKHLETCDQCQAMMSEAARAMGDEGPAASCVLAAGEQLAGRFNVVRFVARGGMGEVYEAFDTVLQERVALKTLSVTTLDDAKSVEMLLAEVRLARRVTHRNVCRILELGLYHKRGESIPFLTMEFLEGETLGARLRRTGQLSSKETARVSEQLVAGLGAIHRASIVHRDNVMLVPDSADVERAVVMDFGLARAMTTPLSGIRVAVGTPPYMAPEQIEGKPATPAFDIYALGVVMVEMLTGRLPRSDRSGLPRPWKSVVGRCLEHLPEQRFTSVDQVAAALLVLKKPHGRRVGMLGALVAGVVAVLALGFVARRDRARTVPPDSNSDVKATAEAPRAAPAPPNVPPVNDTRSNAAAPPVPPAQASRHRRPPKKQPAAPVEQSPPAASAPAQAPSAPADEDLLAPPPPRKRHPDDVISPF
jgi:tRNA A-37 threonylcarbamoyl transferase component Bud32